MSIDNYNKELSKDPLFKTEKTVLSNDAFAICEIINSMAELISRRIALGARR